jgi:3-oxoacyl-[acyl-carrier protein] reductase
MHTNFELSDRTAVVSGAASDIGAAIALRFAAAGANVVIGDVDEERLAALLDRFGAARSRVRVLRTDVTRRSDVEALVDLATREFGSLEVMVNLAGVIHDAKVVDTLEADLDRVIAVNLKGVFFGCQAAVAAMRAMRAVASDTADNAGRSGSIINMASLAAFKPMSELACYAISKAGVVALTKVLATEVGRESIRVNAIAPGFIEGGMTTRRARRTDGSLDEELLEATRTRARRNPLRTTGTPDDVADAALYLASDASRYMTGQVLHANGGSYMP